MKQSMRIKLAVCAAGLLFLAGLGCKAPEQITYVPTPKPETQRIVINHELEAPEHTVVVAGYGEVIAAPDFATITLGVHTKGDTAENASIQCTERMQSVIDAAIGLGVRKADVSTTGIDIEAEIKEADGSIIGYTARESITIIARNVSLANSIMSTAIDTGASEIYSISYSITDASAAYRRALAAAMEDARSKADAIAEASSLTLGAIIGVEEAPYDDNKLIGVTFESSAIAVSAGVTVTYKIP